MHVERISYLFRLEIRTRDPKKLSLFLMTIELADTMPLYPTVCIGSEWHTYYDIYYIRYDVHFRYIFARS